MYLNFYTRLAKKTVFKLTLGGPTYVHFMQEIMFFWVYGIARAHWLLIYDVILTLTG